MLFTNKALIHSQWSQWHVSESE